MNRSFAVFIGLVATMGVVFASLYLGSILMQPTPIVNASGVTVKSTLVMQTGAEYQVNNICKLVYSGKLATYSHYTPVFTVILYTDYSYQIYAGDYDTNVTFVVGDMTFRVVEFDFDHVHLEILEG
jgi:hypothetical protein